MNRTAALLASPVLAAATAVGATALLLNATAETGHAQSSAEAASVAVVDLQRVVSESKAFASNRDRLQAELQSLQDELKTRNDEVAAVRMKLETLDPAADEAAQLRRDLVQKATATEAWAKVSQQMSGTEQVRAFMLVHDAALDAVQSVAQETGVDVVITRGSTLNANDIPANTSVPQISAAAFANSKIVYHANARDLTDRVITRMNAEFEAGG